MGCQPTPELAKPRVGKPFYGTLLRPHHLWLHTLPFLSSLQMPGMHG